MYDWIKYLASWTSVKSNKFLGQRGAEMVEYAVVLACIAALGYAYYRPASGEAEGHKGWATLNGVLTDLWYSISDKSDSIMGK